MEKIFIEKKTYKIKELATLIGVGEQKNLKRATENKLRAMGFIKGEHYSFPEGTKGKIVILWIPQTAKEKIIYLTRLLGQDVRSDPLGFALFVYHLIESEDFQCRPWEERAKWLKDVEGIEATEKTLRSWCSFLIRNDTLIKDKDNFSWWMTTSIDGEKIREELCDDDETLVQYKEENKKYWTNEEGLSSTDLKANWFPHMWATFGCKFYKCYAYTFGAWHSEVLQELITAIEAYKEQQ